MRVKDLIAKLQTFDPELPVCVADWQEQCRDPSEQAAETVALAQNSFYYPADETVGHVIGDYICIGGG